jgi:DNA-binding response OmpR family regulator
MMKSTRPILLVEDDTVDVMTVKRALKELRVTNRVDVADNGEDAFAWLKNSHHERPCLILLDLNMPKMNGLEFLKLLKHDETLKRIPVVILTTSTNEQDKIESFKLGVAGYMVKPVDYQQFVDVVKTIDRYWTLSEIPNGG